MTNIELKQYIDSIVEQQTAMLRVMLDSQMTHFDAKLDEFKVEVRPVLDLYTTGKTGGKLLLALAAVIAAASALVSAVIQYFTGK